MPLEVVAYPAGGEGVAPASPSRTGSSPYEGAEIAPVTVNAKGFQRIDTASSAAVVTDEEGKASLTYATPGLYRVKATVAPLGIEESVVRSNGLEICVENAPGECDGTEQVTPPAVTAPIAPATTPPAPAEARISKPRLDRADLVHGRLKLNWQVLDQGAGIEGWRLAVKALDGKGGFVTRAHGNRGTSVSVRLPRPPLPGALHLGRHLRPRHQLRPRHGRGAPCPARLSEGDSSRRRRCSRS